MDVLNNSKLNQLSPKLERKTTQILKSPKNKNV